MRRRDRGREKGGGGVLWTLFQYEMRMLLRDRRTLLITVVAPLVLFPVMILLMRTVEQAEERRLEEATYTFAVTGSRADEARVWVGEALALAETRRAAEEGGGFRFLERDAEGADALLGAGEIDLLVRAFGPAEYRALLEAERREAGPPEEGDEDGAQSEAPLPVDVPVLRLLFQADRGLSRAAMERLGDALLDYRTERQQELYRERGLPVAPEVVAQVQAANVASAEREGGALIGLALTPFLLLLMLSGGSIVAADTIAGEKERGTLETLLTTGARRSQIVDAKMLSIAAVGVAVAVVNALNLLLYLVIGVFELPPDFAFAMTPMALLVVLILLLPLTVLVASALLLLSGYAGSYKEYQIYFFPVFVLFILPSLAGMLPGMRLASAIAVVPVANVGVAMREVMVGDFDWPFLALSVAANAVYAWWLAGLTGRALSTERLISRADLDEADLFGGPALFPRHVLAWFGVMWVLLLMLSLWLGERVGLRGQITVNLVGLFLGGTLLMLWRYRLPVKEALALRPVRPMVWLAVLIGAPSALLVGNGVAQLAQTVLPVSDRMLEAFGQYLLPEALPLWQIIFFLAILPGVCEELAFRGVLLHGLSRHLRPVPLTLVVGLIFGLFHVSLFRIVPTAYMGVVLTAVTLLTGSVLPAIVWHAVNNAAALVPARLGWIDADLSLAPWTYGVAAAGLALAFAILWRVRTPYPLLRDRQPRQWASDASPHLQGIRSTG